MPIIPGENKSVFIFPTGPTGASGAIQRVNIWPTGPGNVGGPTGAPNGLFGVWQQITGPSGAVAPTGTFKSVINLGTGITGFKNIIVPGYSASGTVYSTWNASNKGTGLTLSNGNLKVQQTSGSGGQDVYGTGVHANNSGKWYLEFTCDATLTGNGSVGVAFSTGTAVSGGASYSPTTAAVLGRFGGSGVFGSGYGDGLGNIDGGVVSVAVDMVNKAIWFRLNGGNWNGSASNNPATNTGGHAFGGGYSTQSLVPYCELANNPDYYTLNVGASAFSYTLPSGFSAWG